MDRKWLSAIQVEVKKDTEYVEMMRVEGGVAQEIDFISRKFGGSDDEFMQALATKVKQDKHVSLGICALQDAYVAIKKKREVEKTRLAADGKQGDMLRDELKKRAH